MHVCGTANFFLTLSLNKAASITIFAKPHYDLYLLTPLAPRISNIRIFISKLTVAIYFRLFILEPQQVSKSAQLVGDSQFAKEKAHQNHHIITVVSTLETQTKTQNGCQFFE